MRSITSTVTDSTSVASMESGHMYAALEGKATASADKRSKRDANSTQPHSFILPLLPLELLSVLQFEAGLTFGKALRSVLHVLWY